MTKSVICVTGVAQSYKTSNICVTGVAQSYKTSNICVTGVAQSYKTSNICVTGVAQSYKTSNICVTGVALSYKTSIVNKMATNNTQRALIDLKKDIWLNHPVIKSVNYTRLPSQSYWVSLQKTIDQWLLISCCGDPWSLMVSNADQKVDQWTKIIAANGWPWSAVFTDHYLMSREYTILWTRI